MGHFPLKESHSGMGVSMAMQQLPTQRDCAASQRILETRTPFCEPPLCCSWSQLPVCSWSSGKWCFQNWKQVPGEGQEGTGRQGLYLAVMLDPILCPWTVCSCILRFRPPSKQPYPGLPMLHHTATAAPNLVLNTVQAKRSCSHTSGLHFEMTFGNSELSVSI